MFLICKQYRALLGIIFLSVTICCTYSHPIITPTEYLELDIAGLLDCIDYTHSADGRNKLNALLAPSSDIVCIEKNQTIIKDLCFNDSLRQKLDSALHNINDIDQNWWNDYAKIHQEFHAFFPKKIYAPHFSWNGGHPKIGLGNKQLSDCPTALCDALFWTRQYTLLQYLTLVIGMEHASTESLIRYVLSTYNIDVQKKRGLLPWIKSVLQGMTLPFRVVWPYNIKFDPKNAPIKPEDNHAQLLETTFALMYYTGGSIKDIYDSFTLYLTSQWMRSFFAHCIAFPAALMYAGFSVYSYATKSKYVIDQTITLHSTLENTKQYLKNVHAYLAAAHSINTTIQEHGSSTIKELCKPLQACLYNGSASFKKLMALLQSKTFQNGRFIYRRGLVMRAFLLYGTIKKEIAIIKKTIALLDAYLSFALLIRNHQQLPNSYCFATIDATQNMIHCQDAWLPTLLKNPKLHSASIATNNVLYGYNSPNKGLICGPNGSGKSMILKTLGVGVILAQSVGIFPAKSAILPLFDSVKTCINPQENSAQGLSFFGSELIRLEEIKHAVSTCTQNKKLLVLFDEPCRGTHPQETVRRFGEFCIAVAHNPNAYIFCTSHNQELVALIQSAINSFFMVQHMEILHPNPGNFIQTYQLKHGAPHWWFNDEQQRTEYIDWFIEHVIKPQIPFASTQKAD